MTLRNLWPMWWTLLLPSFTLRPAIPTVWPTSSRSHPNGNSVVIRCTIPNSRCPHYHRAFPLRPSARSPHHAESRAWWCDPSVKELKVRFSWARMAACTALLFLRVRVPRKTMQFWRPSDPGAIAQPCATASPPRPKARSSFRAASRMVDLKWGRRTRLWTPREPPAGPPGSSQKPSPEGDLAVNPTVDEFFTRLRSDMRHPSPSEESIELPGRPYSASPPRPRRPQFGSFLASLPPCAALRNLRTPESPGEPVLWDVRPAACF